MTYRFHSESNYYKGLNSSLNTLTLIRGIGGLTLTLDADNWWAYLHTEQHQYQAWKHGVKTSWQLSSDCLVVGFILSLDNSIL